MTGRVALVGAGPGDPALLTVRAAELLREAEVVAYDELVSASILALVPACAELLPVGRRAGHGEATFKIHSAVIERAREGRLVVRLKAGDPLVFGRGGEEASELAAAGIPFEIVPGITAALGAAAYAGIPLTHRGVAAELLVTTGKRGATPLPPGGDAPARGRTLVMYMAAGELAAHCAGLMATGWAPQTPAALVVAATAPNERTFTGTLATLPAMAAGRLQEDPALVIVGEAVGLRASIDWRARLPLRGFRVVVARAHDAASRAATDLRTAGAEVVELPHTRALGSARWPSRTDLVVLPGPSAVEALYVDAPAHLFEVPAVAANLSAAELALRLGVADVRLARADSPDGLLTAAREALGRAGVPAAQTILQEVLL